MDVACAIHLHSTYSDGTATVEEIIADARSAGLDAVLLTDHDTLGARTDGWEGWHEGVLLLVGHEVSPKSGHLLVFGADAPIAHGGRSEEGIVADARAADALTIAAHPFSRGSRISRQIAPPHPWRRTDLVDGVEVWSLFTDAAEGWRSPREALAALRGFEASLDGPPPRNLAEWDSLCARRPTVGIGGLDAHQPGVRLRGRVRSPLPNALGFRLLRTHVLCAAPLTGDLPSDRRAVYGALAAGRCYIARDSLADPRGFRFAASRPNDEIEMGASGEGEGWTLRAELPMPARVAVRRDGQHLVDELSESLELEVDRPGAYRVEASLTEDRRDRTWILSNPIYLR